MKLSDFINQVTDCNRRDLTINSMSMTFDGELIDPFNGLQDLSDGQVNFVGVAEQRIKEDYLRILRWFRFNARFGTVHNVNSNAWQAILEHKQGLEQISAERVWSEIKAILKYPQGPDMLRLMCDHAINVHIKLPGYNNGNGSKGFCDIIDARSWTNSPEVLMAAWVGWHGPSIVKLGNDWKWSNYEREHVSWLYNHAWTNADICKLIALENSPREWVRELAHWENRDDWEKNALVEWVFPPFPVNGHDIQALGVARGPEIGKIINKLKHKWADGGYTATKQELLAEL